MLINFIAGLVFGWAALRWWNIPRDGEGWDLIGRRLTFLVVSLALVSVMEQGLSEINVFFVLVLLVKSAACFLFLFGPQPGANH